MTVGEGDGGGVVTRGGGVSAIDSDALLPLLICISLSSSWNEHRKMKHGAKFIIAIRTEYSAGIIFSNRFFGQNVRKALNFSSIQLGVKKLFQIFLIFSDAKSSESHGKKSVRVPANLSESIEISLEIPMDRFSIGIFCWNTRNF